MIMTTIEQSGDNQHWTITKEQTEDNVEDVPSGFDFSSCLPLILGNDLQNIDLLHMMFAQEVNLQVSEGDR